MDKTNWKEVKHRGEAWSHIRTDLTGKADTCLCIVCKSEYELPEHARASKRLYVARTHYYKHKRWEVINEPTDNIAVERPLF